MKTTVEDVRHLYGDKVIDKDAYTLAELREYSNVGIAQTTAVVNAAVERGEWEQVWKRSKEGRLVKAFRKK